MAKNQPEYLIWWAMVDRCYNPSNKQYADYGGRGIGVCEQWRASWRCFLADVGPRPTPELVLDREDNERPYEPGNVRWVTRAVSAENRRCTVWITHCGRRQSLAVWAKEFNIDLRTLHSRIRREMAFSDAVSKPVRSGSAV